jgi:hypothetical protein
LLQIRISNMGRISNGRGRRRALELRVLGGRVLQVDGGWVGMQQQQQQQQEAGVATCREATAHGSNSSSSNLLCNLAALR